MSYLLGLDASYAQGGDINFGAAKAAGYDFWLQRMSYAYPGQGCKNDTTASTNYYGAKSAGFIVGGYHKVGWTDPIAEAEFFVKAMSPLDEGDLLAYDKEPKSDVVIPANWAEWEQQFVQHVHDLTGVWMFDYSNISMFNTMPRQGAVTNCGPWIAAPSYSFDATLPVNGVVIMQQGPTAQVPGVPHNVVDTNAFFGTREDLLKYAYHVQDQTPQATPAPSAAPEPAAQPEPVSEPQPTPPAPEPTPAPEATKPEPQPVVVETPTQLVISPPSPLIVNNPKTTSLLKRVLGSDPVRRTFHTFWQAGGGVLYMHLFFASSPAQVKAAVVAVAAAYFAALKAVLADYLKGRKG